MSTPTSLDLPNGVRRTTIETSRGSFAALGAVPASGVCERDAALLIPGYTGSKEDFLAILDLLADGSRHVVAIDMRGQFETPAADDPDGYRASALGLDIAAIIHATGARHLVGHSYGGLVAREAILAGLGLASFTLMSSGPAALTGPRARELRAMLATLGARNGHLPDKATLGAGISQLWQERLEPQAVAAGVPAPIVAFLTKRMLSNDPDGLVLMARHMLTAADRTAELAQLSQLPILVIYGENDNSWSPAAQENMARRLNARRVCIPGAVHSPAVEAPATTASALTQFWDAAEASTARHPANHRTGVAADLDSMIAIARGTHASPWGTSAPVGRLAAKRSWNPVALSHISSRGGHNGPAGRRAGLGAGGCGGSWRRMRERLPGWEPDRA